MLKIKILSLLLNVLITLNTELTGLYKLKKIN
jgi:hypothetical protein